MQTFLDHVAEYSLKNYPDNLSELCIVFPNRRASLFFKAALARQSKQAFWAPEIYSIEDFIIKLTELEMIDPIAQLFELYEVHREIEKEKAESFDEFARWGQILLSDFNEIDSYLVDPVNLFSNLKNIKELDNWSLGESELTSFQQEYLRFWESIGTYYQLFVEKLLKHRQAYQGLAYRIVAAKALENVQHHNWHKIIFAGFNALNAAEEKIFRELINVGRAEILWDADSYYTDNKIQEAGRFLRKHMGTELFKSNTEKKFQWIGDNLSTDKKQITVTGVSKNVGQAKLAGQLLSDFLIANPQTNLTQTAIVLADENLLFPVLHSLPDAVSGVNVTMGYPLKNTAIAGFSELVFQLHENALRMNRQGKFYHQDVINLMSHPYSKTLLDTNSDSLTPQIINYLQKKNIIFCTLNTFESILSKSTEDKKNILHIFFTKWITVDAIFDCLYSLVDNFRLKLNASWKQKQNPDPTSANLELEYLFAYSKIVKRIKSLTETYSAVTTIKTFRSLLNQLIRSTNLTFYGEPVSGLQVMGMLETRTLDFENIILLSANEGVLPSGKTHNSFIPFDVKRVFGLPTYSEKDSIFAYHFYRLLQRAKTVHIMYNSETDNLGGGEKSRFLTQLLYEFTQVNKVSTIKEQLLEVNISQHPEEAIISISKTQDILDAIYVKGIDGFSPSLLNVYRNCSLRFYFHLIAGLRDEKEVEETIGADTLGNVIHDTLEELYKPFVNQLLVEKDLKEMQKVTEEKLMKNFRKHYDAEDLGLGKNLLTLKVANKFLFNFLDKELETIRKAGSGNTALVIQQLERSFESMITIGTNAVKTKGKIDRIDTLHSLTRIIDYKTGKAEDKELKLTEWETLQHSVNLNKSFQLLMYAWLFAKNNPNHSRPIVSGIISFRELNAGLKTVKILGSEILTNEYLQQFELVLKAILQEIYDPLVPFTKTADHKACEYCDFQTICNR